mgnify:CR=1 FL=1
MNTITLTRKTGASKPYGWNAVRLTADAYEAATRLAARSGRGLKDTISELILITEPLIRFADEPGLQCEDCPYNPNGGEDNE